MNLRKIASHLARSTARRAALIEVVDTSQMKHPQDSESIQIYQSSDPKYDNLFRFFESFHIPISLFIVKPHPKQLGGMHPDYVEAIRSIINPQAIYIVIRNNVDVGPGWLSHDIFHGLLEFDDRPSSDVFSIKDLHDPTLDSITFSMMDEFNDAFKQDFADAIETYKIVDLESINAQDRAMNYIDDQTLRSQMESLSSKFDPTSDSEESFDVYPDLFVHYVIRNGDFAPLTLKYQPTYVSLYTENPELEAWTVSSSPGKRDGHDEPIKIFPNDMSLPNLTRVLNKFNQKVYDRIKQTFSKFIGKPVLI